MLGRPIPLWILGILGMIGGLACTIVVLQFAGVIPWAGDEASYIGGDWTGALVYAFVAGLMFGAAYAWLTVKPWASMITILAALIGFFIPFISHMDGTDPRSSAIAPLIVSVLMLFMVFRPSTNRAMAMALSGQGSVKTPKAPPPAKPMSAARKRELAAEQKQSKNGTPAAAPAQAAPVVASSPAVATSPAAPASAPAPAPTKSAASMVMSAATSLKAAAATPASPRKSVAAPAKPPVSSAPAPPPAQRPRGFRADEV